MITAFFVFVLGTVFGSFASAWLHRLRFGGSVFKGRSKCASCAQDLSAVDLIPVVSYIIRRGRCRMCKQRVSWQYLALEVGMGVLFLLALNQSCGTLFDSGLTTGCAPSFARHAVFFFFLALVFVYDARHGEIPDAISVTGMVLGTAINLITDPSNWLNLLLAIAVGTAFFGAQYVVGRGRWVGSGDIVLGAMLGAMLGWPQVLVAIFIAYILGLLVVIVLLAMGKKKLTDTIPLGPFLTTAAALVLVTPLGDAWKYFYSF